MANVNAPFGMRPISHLTGGAVRHGKPYAIASGYATALYEGDPVKMVGTSRNIEAAAATDQNLIGVFAGCVYKVTNGGRVIFSKKWPASQAVVWAQAHVFDDPDLVFEIQANTVALADIGQMCDFVLNGGNDATLRSGYEANAGAAAGTAKPLKILGLSNRPGTVVGAFANIQVMFASHYLSNVAVGAGAV